jgi:hypothetical protein
MVSEVLKRRIDLSISRWQFLLSTTVTGAGLILPSTFGRLFDYFEKTNGMDGLLAAAIG